jgi:hypothetical protein
MKIYLKEKIGNPELFTGRKQELNYFLDWIDGIKREISKSSALISRRKTGKTALLQRLYNITFHKNDVVIPFYFEIKETNQWIGDFCKDFFLTFVFQYIAFKTRNEELLAMSTVKTFEKAIEISQKEGFAFLVEMIKVVRARFREEDTQDMWNIAREAPRAASEYNDERVVQMIDEFQFINRFIYNDKLASAHRIDNLAGSYFHTCEYKNAPLLVAGSWVGWLMDDLNRMLPGRFLKKRLENMPEEEAVEMIFKYSLLNNIPVTQETAHLIAQLSEGNPFYIDALFRSVFKEKNLSTKEGVRKTLEFETLDPDGSINATWMEYIDAVFPRINQVHAKDIVLYLSKHRDRNVSRKELKEFLKLEMPDIELEKKLKALYKSDIIEEDAGGYRGVRDNIFDKVFRRSYSDDIDKFLAEEAQNEYKALFEEIQREYKKLSGEYNCYKGAFAEFVITHHLKFDAVRNNDLFKSMIDDLPDDFNFTDYETAWSYSSPPLHKPEFQIDVFARARKENYSLIMEVKNRETKFSLGEAARFLEIARELIRLEQVEKTVLLVFSRSGFHTDAIKYLKENHIARSSDPRWLDEGMPGDGGDKD